MKGFVGALSFNEKLIKGDWTFESDGFCIKRTSNTKFLKDKLCFEKNDLFFLLEGVITNSSELCAIEGNDNWEETFYSLYEKNKDFFFQDFRGSFCGLIYNKKTKTILLYVDHFRSKDVFYTIYEDVFYFSTSIRSLIDIRKKEFTLNIDAAYLLLTFGATLEERTLFNEIKKIPYGSSLKRQDETVFIEQYYKINVNYNNLKPKKYSEYIDELDAYFKQAINRQFSKDLEYGYGHLVGLSAGRDSRMTAWVSHEMGYKEKVLNFTFSESGQLDESIPKEIAKELENEWLFKSLDNGKCFMNFEAVNEVLCGELSLQNVLHSQYFFKDFNFSDYGLIHTGQIGDGIVNYYGSNHKSQNLDEITYIQSKILLNKIVKRNIIDRSEFQSDEEFNHVYRGIGITLSSAQFIYQYTETFSPFNDLDFFNYCLSIPYDIRKGVKFYDNWMLTKYSDSVRFSHNGRKIGAKEYSFLGKTTTLGELPVKIKNFINYRLLRKKNVLLTGMNPMDKWYVQNKNLSALIESFYQRNIDKVQDNELREDIIDMFSNGNTGDKMQVITLLTTLKQYF